MSGDGDDGICLGLGMVMSGDGDDGMILRIMPSSPSPDITIPLPRKEQLHIVLFDILQNSF